MSLTRAELEQDGAREALRAAGHGAGLWTDEELDASLACTFKHWCGQSDVWLFGYGSLIWNPQVEYVEKRLATLRGYHRSLCLWSHINRGTHEQPGLVLGLEPTGECEGMVFRIPKAVVEREMVLVWRREMLMGSYQPVWVRVETITGEVVRALTFLVRPDHPSYANNLADSEVVEIMKVASGRYGSCADYVCNTLTSLHENGIDDPALNRICCQFFRT
jgi:glutathione-specific gamma-glutamylcyclotransferase